MTNIYRFQNFKKIYPNASDEIINLLKTTERKMRYQEYDLKVERVIIDKKNQTLTIVPSREDSYERLMESSIFFAEDVPSIEEQAIHQIEVDKLYNALTFLDSDEKYLILQLYIEQRTERDLAKELGRSQNSIHKRRQRILKKLRWIMENI